VFSVDLFDRLRTESQRREAAAQAAFNALNEEERVRMTERFVAQVEREHAPADADARAARRSEGGRKAVATRTGKPVSKAPTLRAAIKIALGSGEELTSAQIREAVTKIRPGTKSGSLYAEIKNLRDKHREIVDRGVTADGHKLYGLLLPTNGTRANGAGAREGRSATK
jgi:hypothetical protein